MIRHDVLSLLRRPAPPVLALIVLCGAIEIALQAADHGMIGSTYWRRMAYDNGAFWAGLLRGWRPNFAAQPATMFLTHAVLHAGLSHLAGNMLVLLMLGRVVVQRAGQGAFVWLCLISAVSGGGAFGLLTHSPAPMVGTSGILFGLAGTWVAWERHDRRASRLPLWPLAVMLAGLAALNAAFYITSAGQLAWEAHVGGFIAGWIWGARHPGRISAL
jgi:rhomboid protease GluP